MMRQEKNKMSLEQLVVPENNKVLEKKQGPLNETQKSTWIDPKGQKRKNLSNKIIKILADHTIK